MAWRRSASAISVRSLDASPSAGTRLEFTLNRCDIAFDGQRACGAWGTDGRRIFVAGGEVTTTELVGAFRAIEAYDTVTNSWMTLPPMPMPRHGVAGAVIGNRFHLVSDVIDRVPKLGPRAAYAKQAIRDKLIEHKQYINEYGEDMPEIRKWKWSMPALS